MVICHSSAHRKSRGKNSGWRDQLGGSLGSQPRSEVSMQQANSRDDFLEQSARWMIFDSTMVAAEGQGKGT